MRSRHDVTRGAALSLSIDGRTVEAFEGETVAAAMLAADRRAFRLDRAGRPRGLFCNMGVCSECLVDIETEGQTRRLRACVTPVGDGMTITTGAAT